MHGILIGHGDVQFTLEAVDADFQFLDARFLLKSQFGQLIVIRSLETRKNELG